jgi:hypothetical protein
LLLTSTEIALQVKVCCPEFVSCIRKDFNQMHWST